MLLALVQQSSRFMTAIVPVFLAVCIYPSFCVGHQRKFVGINSFRYLPSWVPPQGSNQQLTSDNLQAFKTSVVGPSGAHEQQQTAPVDYKNQLINEKGQIDFQQLKLPNLPELQDKLKRLIQARRLNLYLANSPLITLRPALSQINAAEIEAATQKAGLGTTSEKPSTARRHFVNCQYSPVQCVFDPDLKDISRSYGSLVTNRVVRIVPLYPINV